MTIFIIEIIIGGILLIEIFWLLCLTFSQIFGAPTVYSSKKAIFDALKLSDLKKGETIIDLGCGNARSLIIAAQEFGAKGIGFEYSLFYYLIARWRVYLSGNNKNIKIFFGNFKKAEKYLENADVVYLYLLNSVLKKIEIWLFKSVGKKTKIVSLAFYFPNHKPKKVIDTKTLGQKTKIRLYTS